MTIEREREREHTSSFPRGEVNSQCFADELLAYAEEVSSKDKTYLQTELWNSMLRKMSLNSKML